MPCFALPLCLVKDFFFFFCCWLIILVCCMICANGVCSFVCFFQNYDIHQRLFVDRRKWQVPSENGKFPHTQI